MPLLHRWIALALALYYVGQHQLRAALRMRFHLCFLENAVFDEAQKRRCRHYFRGALFLGAVYAARRRRALDVAEMERFAYLSALAAYFDDLVETFTASSLSAAFPHSGATTASALWLLARQIDGRGGLWLLWEQLQYRLPAGVIDLFDEKLRRLFDIETRSLAVGSKEPSLSVLTRTAALKGGYSALLFRLLLSPYPSPAERRMAMALGAMVQAGDDIFDLWHDARRQHQTPALYWASKGQLGEVARHFDRCWFRFEERLAATSGSGLGRAAAHATGGLLAALTRFCLHHYDRLNKKHGTLPWERRSAMVLDMALWSNRLRALIFVLRKELFFG